VVCPGGRWAYNITECGTSKIWCLMQCLSLENRDNHAIPDREKRYSWGSNGLTLNFRGGKKTTTSRYKARERIPANDFGTWSSSHYSRYRTVGIICRVEIVRCHGVVCISIDESEGEPGSEWKTDLRTWESQESTSLRWIRFEDLWNSSNKTQPSCLAPHNLSRFTCGMSFPFMV